MKTVTITLTEKQARSTLNDLREIARHFDLDAFFDGASPNSIETLIEKLDQGLMSDGSGDQPFDADVK